MKTDRNGGEVKVGDVIHGPGSGCERDHELQHLGQVAEIGEDGVAVVRVLGTARLATAGTANVGGLIIDHPYPGAKVSMDIPNCARVPLF